MNRGVAPAALCVLALAGCAVPPGSAANTDPLRGTVTVFAAASLAETFGELAASFEAGHPDIDVVLNFGGSAGLATQIVEGAPADVFAAANAATMKTVTDAGLTASAPTDFASNVLELVVPAGNPGSVTELRDLANPDLVVVLCAIEVPCGAAAQTVLDSAGVTPGADSYEQDVRAVLTKIQLGEADAGLVYATDVVAAGDSVEGIAFPGADQAVNVYPIAPITHGGAAAAFVAHVLSAQGQAVLSSAGFGAP